MKNKKRDVLQVIDKVISIIPDGYEYKGEIITKLNYVKSIHQNLGKSESSTRSAWMHAGAILESYLGDPDTEWKQYISTVFSGSPSKSK